MIEKIVGILLIIIAIILGAVHFIGKIFYASDVKWYFRGLVIVIGIIGIIILAWGYMKSSSPKKPA
jgi:Na+/melibiose symporter-like transporter